MNKLEIKWSYAEGSFDLDTAQMVCIPQKNGIADLCLQDGMNFTLAEIQTGLPESNSKFGYEIEKRFNAYHKNEKRIADLESEIGELKTQVSDLKASDEAHIRNHEMRESYVKELQAEIRSNAEILKNKSIDYVVVPRFIEWQSPTNQLPIQWTFQDTLDAANEGLEHLKKHDCDCHGWEQRYYALLAMKAMKDKFEKYCMKQNGLGEG